MKCIVCVSVVGPCSHHRIHSSYFFVYIFWLKFHGSLLIDGNFGINIQQYGRHTSWFNSRLLNLMSNDSRPNGNDGDNNLECLVFVAMLKLMLDGFVLAFSFEVDRSTEYRVKRPIQYKEWIHRVLSRFCCDESFLPFCPGTNWPGKLMECKWSWRSSRSNWPKRRTLGSTWKKWNEWICEKMPYSKRKHNIYSQSFLSRQIQRNFFHWPSVWVSFNGPKIPNCRWHLGSRAWVIMDMRLLKSYCYLYRFSNWKMKLNLYKWSEKCIRFLLVNTEHANIKNRHIIVCS